MKISTKTPKPSWHELNADSHWDIKPVWYFLDDEREPPRDTTKNWVIFRDANSMVDHITIYGWPDGISFDHDLGAGDTGADAIRFLVTMVGVKIIQPPHETFEARVHSQNPIGAENIRNWLLQLYAI